MKTIGITGGTGFVGAHLSSLLISKGYNVTVFTRHIPTGAPPKGVRYAVLDAAREACDTEAFKNLDAVVNLAGAGIADERWTPARKKEIADSRIKGTEFLIARLRGSAPRCKAFIAASATGFYGADHAGTAPFDESAPPAGDFLGNTCRDWEAASESASNFLRTVTLRFGIVLGKESGAFPQFVKPMGFGVMPILGSGKQIVSWIEIDDLASLIVYALEQQTMAGIYNAVAPSPVTHEHLMKTIAKKKGGIKIPVPVPAVMLKIGLGELSTEILKSCTVSASKTLASGFVFRYPEISGAVKAILA